MMRARQAVASLRSMLGSKKQSSWRPPSPLTSGNLTTRPQLLALASQPHSSRRLLQLQPIIEPQVPVVMATSSTRTVLTRRSSGGSTRQLSSRSLGPSGGGSMRDLSFASYNPRTLCTMYPRG